MRDQLVPSPLVFVKLVLWIVVIVIATLLLQRRKVTSRLRIAFLAGGVLLFGFVFGVLILAIPDLIRWLVGLVLLVIGIISIVRHWK